MFPETKEQRDKLKALIEESVQFHREKEVLDEDLKNNATIATEIFDMSKKEYNQLVKAAVDKAKLQDQIEELSTTVSNYEILQGC